MNSGAGYVVPANGETITSWSTNASDAVGQTMTLKVFRPTAPSTYEVVAHDGPRNLTPGTSTSGTVNNFSGLSLAVQPGDVIGLYPDNADTVNDACIFPSGGNSYLFSNTNLGTGSSAPFSTATDDLLNVSAVVQLATPPPGAPVQRTLSVKAAGAGHGTVQSAPAGIEACASSCSQAFDENTSITLTAHPDAYSTFTGWSGGGCSGTATCHITIHSDASVTATFVPVSYGGEPGGYGNYGSYGESAGGGNAGSGATPSPSAHRKCKKAHGKKKPRKAKCAQKTKLVAKRARNAALSKTILTTTKGLTLYSLSAETNGHFICADSSCLSVWHPLSVPAGVRPIGPVKLGTVIRPDGSTQATYHHLPLYSFGGDTAPGQANGEGLVDIGTWHAALVPAPKR